MSQQNDVFAATLKWVVVLGVVAGVILYVLTKLFGGPAAEQDLGARAQQIVEQRIQPMARVNAGEVQQVAAASASVSRSPKEVYEATCASCHGSGVMGAPKMGSAGDWNTRLGGGLDAVVRNAINGINAMPARGGNPALSDDDMRQTIEYMLEESGVKL